MEAPADWGTAGQDVKPTWDRTFLGRAQQVQRPWGRTAPGTPRSRAEATVASQGEQARCRGRALVGDRAAPTGLEGDCGDPGFHPWGLWPWGESQQRVRSAKAQCITCSPNAFQSMSFPARLGVTAEQGPEAQARGCRGAGKGRQQGRAACGRGVEGLALSASQRR